MGARWSNNGSSGNTSSYSYAPWKKLIENCVLGLVWLLATPWTIAHQALLSMGFFRQEYWVGCHALLQGIFLTQGFNPCLLRLLHLQEGSWPPVPSGKPCSSTLCIKYRVFCIAGRFFTIWGTRKAPNTPKRESMLFSILHLKLWDPQFTKH